MNKGLGKLADHNKLLNKNIADQHIESAITDLVDDLALPKVGSKVLVIAETGGNYTDIQSAINGANNYDVINLNSKSTGVWNENIVIQDKSLCLNGYFGDTNNFSFIKTASDVITCRAVGGICEFVLKNISVECDGGGNPLYFDGNAHSILNIINCFINQSAGGNSALKCYLDNDSSINISNSKIQSSSIAGIEIPTIIAGTFNIIIQQNSRIITNGAIPSILLDIPGSGPVNLYLYNSNFIVDTATYCINKLGDGTLNIFVSNIGYNCANLVNPASTGDINIEWED